jgi:CRISPR-associated protein Csm4
MKTCRLTLRPLTQFGTPLAGDTLFGHLCWAVRERHGERRLAELLQGYTDGQPFAAVSDAFPAGMLPKPTVPLALLGIEIDPAQRKQARERRWLSLDKAHLPLTQWLNAARSSHAATTTIVTQNTIDRLTGTTGAGPFAPRQIERTVFTADARLELYAVLDERRLDRTFFMRLVQDIGAMGYGRDATTGIGKFAVESVEEHAWPVQRSRHWLTLAPCAPDARSLDPAWCFYQPVTRFGRHGNLAVRFGVPFKHPILMLRTGALLTTREPMDASVHGSPIGGSSAPISQAIPDTVHQGYAPVVPLNVEFAA